MFDPSMIDRLSVVLHTLACTKKHAQKMEELIQSERDPNLCYFYLEESLVGSESQYSHEEWRAFATRFCTDYDLTPEAILSILPTLLECRQKITTILQKHPTAEELCRLVLLSEL